MSTTTTPSDITAILDPFDNLALECDGFTRVASYALTNAGIEHKVMGGKVKAGDKQIPLHFWIEVGDLIVDYRLRMWLGESVPHGVFEKAGCGVEYHGVPSPLSCSSVLFEILTGRES